jgi:ADP-heptose:LPS heptosyltransferase
MLVKIDSLGIGDVIAMTPVLEGIRRDHPNTIIELTTSCPDVFMGNPHISELYEIKRGYNKAYDRVIDLKPVYSSYELLARQAEKLCGTKINNYAPQVFMSRGELNEGKRLVDSLKDDEETTVVGISLQMKRTRWEGRNWSLTEAGRLVSLLQETGAKVIEFGKDIPSTGLADLDLIDQLSLREFMSIVANVDLMICIDSLSLHVAQAFSKHTFCLFGATDPIARIVNWNTVYPIMSDISCVGCYNRKGPQVPDQNQCEIGHSEICMQELSAEEVLRVVTMNREDLLARNIRFLEQHMRRDEV